MSDLVSAPILSTPAEAILEQYHYTPTEQSSIPDEQLDIQYEIRRTVKEIRERRWQRISLQFPDHMLRDAPRVFNRLTATLRSTKIEADDTKDEERLTILGDTSYGACCVDEIAAEHASADGVVHYGRSCLSPTQRLDVIYVYTTRPLDQNAAIAAATGLCSSKDTKLCILADTPWQHHVADLAESLREKGYTNVIAPAMIHDPSATIPNRSTELLASDDIREYLVFHIATPPTSLILTLTSRVKEVYIWDPERTTPSLDTTAPAILRRRYASLLKLSSAAVIGILINTLSVKNYMEALQHVQFMITSAHKKAYTFVVGKLNPAKLANFAEIEGWVVIGCWESSLIDSKEFLAPVITPFELEIALMKDDSRVWGAEWISDFQTLLQRRKDIGEVIAQLDAAEEDISDDEPPEFDLRTGRYVSHARPMRKHVLSSVTSTKEAPVSSDLVQRSKGELATVNGVLSPGAEFLRSKRDWQGLGSDFEIEYDRDEKGNIQGAAIEEGRAGVARGYVHSQLDART